MSKTEYVHANLGSSYPSPSHNPASKTALRPVELLHDACPWQLGSAEAAWVLIPLKTAWGRILLKLAEALSMLYFIALATAAACGTCCRHARASRFQLLQCYLISCYELGWRLGPQIFASAHAANAATALVLTEKGLARVRGLGRLTDQERWDCLVVVTTS
eukprot:5033382-Amphidinium_carterae.1